jgi:hypothetical protein
MAGMLAMHGAIASHEYSMWGKGSSGQFADKPKRQ